MAKQNDSQIKTNPGFKRGYIKYAVFLFVIALGVAFFVIKKDQGQVASTSISVPTAYATETPGWWLEQYFGGSTCSEDKCKSSSDPDHDGLTNEQEYFYHTDPVNSHTAGESMNDGELVAHNFDPSKKGKVTFEQAASDTEILGESLVFDDDIQKMINDEVDPNKVKLAIVSDSELNISKDNSSAAIKKYVQDSNNIVAQNFPGNRDAFIQQAMQSGDPSRIADVNYRIAKSEAALKKMPVPSVLLDAHKYLISFLDLLPDVLNMPPSTLDQNDPVLNAWYDKTRQAMVLFQKIQLETNRLQNQR
jgi:hypothetical protein